MPSLLGALTNEQLAERFKSIHAVKAFSNASTAMTVRYNDITSRSDGLAREWKNLRRTLGADTARRFDALLIRATMNGAYPQHDLGHPDNEHMQDSTDAQKEEARRLQAMYRALPPAYQKLYTRLTTEFSQQRDDLIRALRQTIVSSYYPPDGSTQWSRADMDEAAALPPRARKAFLQRFRPDARRALRSLWNDLEQHGARFGASIQGPYFPLVRFGDHIVTLKSPQYLAAQADLARAQEGFDAATTARSQLDDDATADRIAAADAAADAAREARNVARAALRDLKADGGRYRVEFFDSRAQAMIRQKQLASAYGGADVSLGLKDQYFRELDATSPQFMKRLTERISENMGKSEGAAAATAMRQLYAQLQPDHSVLKNQLRRVNVAGVNEQEALRAFASSTMRNAWATSRLENRDRLNGALDELRFDRDNLDARMIGDELAKRQQLNMQYREHPVLNAMTSATHLYFLGASPAYLVMNLMQPWAVSVPVMAARHGVGKSASAMARATRDAGAALALSYKTQEGGVGRSLNFEFKPREAVKAGRITAGEAQMLEALVKRGRIDITITSDLGADARGTEGNWLGRASRMAGLPAQQVEVLNRVGTALAAYRMEQARAAREGADAVRAATDYADRIVAETHLSYGAENKARWMHGNSWGGWGRVMFQFRSYQQGMLYLIGKNLADFKGDPEARRTLAYLSGAQLAFAGATGLPGMTAGLMIASLLYRAFTDDDDEKDLKFSMYKGIESAVGKELAVLITKGAPAALLGADLSERVGMGGIANVVGRTDDRKTGGDWVADVALQFVGGAPVGLARNAAQGLSLLADGEYTKATGFLLPKMAADVVKAGKMSADGVVDSSGSQYLKPDDLGTWGALVKAMGATPTEQALRSEARSAFYGATEAVKTSRQRLVRQAVTDGWDAVRDDVAGFNQRHPMQRVTVEDVVKAREFNRKKEISLRSGAPVKAADRQLAREMGL